MIARFVKKLAAIIVAVLLVAGVAKATSDFVDLPGHDPDAACHGFGLAPIDQEILYKARAAAVFTVLVTRDGQLEPNGTATLVDDDKGILLTAAHVVHFYKNLPIVVSQRVTGRTKHREYH